MSTNTNIEILKKKSGILQKMGVGIKLCKGINPA